MAVVPVLAVGTAALALGAFVVVLGSGTANPAATPSFNVDALPAAAQDYVPYLEQGGLACADVNAALLAAQVQVSDPSWDPDLTTTYKIQYTYTVGGAGPATTTTTVAPSTAPVPTTAPPPPRAWHRDDHEKNPEDDHSYGDGQGHLRRTSPENSKLVGR